MMKINLNGKEITLHNTLLSDVLNEMNYPTPNIAIAINNTIIPRSEWGKTVLHENDHVEIVHPTQGG